MPDEFLRGKCVLVTGHTGYLGSSLSARLAKSPAKELRLLARRPEAWQPEAGGPSVICLGGDVTIRDTWEAVLDGVDYVFHLAGLEINRVDFDQSADLNENFMAVVHLLRSCGSLERPPCVVFSSSATIAGHVTSVPTSEASPDDPPSIWSLHKLLAEQYLNYYARHQAIKVASLRLANIYGPPANPAAYRNVTLNRITFNALSTKRLVLFPNKDCLRDFLHIDDAISALVSAAENAEQLSSQRYFYVGSGVGISFEGAWTQIGRSIFEHLGEEVALVSEPKPMEPIDLRSFVADSAAFIEATQWTPAVDFRRGVDENVREAIRLAR